MKSINWTVLERENMIANLKTAAFWADLVLTLISIVLATGLITNNTYVQLLGWIVGVLTTLGYHALDIGAKKPPVV
jgi:hypothetical protein